MLINDEVAHAMKSSRARFVVDAKGRAREVILPLDEYNRMQKQLEELACIKAYEAAKTSRERPVQMPAKKPARRSGS